MSQGLSLIDCACGVTSSGWRVGMAYPEPYEYDGVMHRWGPGSDCLVLSSVATKA